MTTALPEYARMLLDVERDYADRPTPEKHRAIRRRLGISSTRFHALLNEVLDMPAASFAEPSLVGRLRHRRERLREARTPKRHGPVVAQPAPREQRRLA